MTRHPPPTPISDSGDDGNAGNAGNTPAATLAIPLEHSYAELPERFYSRTPPTPVAEPRLLEFNAPLAEELGLDPELLTSAEGVQVLAGNAVPHGAHPIAMAYGGHQFGGWVPQLGDGRAILLGEVVDRAGVRRDLQLKGAGRTPWSRRGDGRSSLGPVVREYLGSEAMAALGIPTPRALAAVSTGERVLRQNGPEPGGVMTRVATSHVRVGTFEYFARQGDHAAVERLADYVIRRHYPHLAEDEVPARGLLDAVIGRTAKLVAAWLSVGFIHGVMNTDNTSVVGETLDFGPFGFLDPFRPEEVYSFIDRSGRYAYGQQPGIAHWNLARFAETLLTLLAPEPEEALEVATGILDTFPGRFQAAWHRRLARKIGLAGAGGNAAGGDGAAEAGAEVDDRAAELAEDLLARMAKEEADFTLTFRELSRLSATDPSGDEPVRRLFGDPAAFDGWATSWRARLAAEGRDDATRRREMLATNPAFILRNHLAQAAVDAAVERLDLAPARRLLRVLARPFDDQPGEEDLQRPPEAAERVTTTFCGT